MIDRIKEIIEKNPRHYSKIIRRDPELLNWVVNNSVATSNEFIAQLRSAVYGETDQCEYGKQRKIHRFNQGFIGCGPANQCECTRAAISKSVEHTKKAVDQTTQEKINQKRANSMMAKYGSAHNLQRAEVKKILSIPKIQTGAHSLVSDKNWLENQYVTLERSLVDIAAELGIYYGTVADYCRRHGLAIRPYSNYSITEKQLADYVRSLGVDIITNDRMILSGKELDIVVPSQNLAIEVNGLYWHSYNPTSPIPEDRLKHYRKTRAAMAAGYQLLHFTDWQWRHKRPIVEGILTSKLQLNQKIFARQCQLGQISAKQARDFFELNHLDGFASASEYWALIHQGHIVQCIGSGKKRFGDRSGVEIIRLASRTGITVTGGLSRLLAAIQREHPGEHISTYCSNDISHAAGYRAVGFRVVSETGPGYIWTDGTEVVSRYQCQRKNLARWLTGYDPAKSESANLFAAGYRRYWNSGNTYLEL
jgi:hypothetical protein